MVNQNDQTSGNGGNGNVWQFIVKDVDGNAALMRAIEKGKLMTVGRKGVEHKSLMQAQLLAGKGETFMPLDDGGKALFSAWINFGDDTHPHWHLLGITRHKQGEKPEDEDVLRKLTDEEPWGPNRTWYEGIILRAYAPGGHFHNGIWHGSS